MVTLGVDTHKRSHTIVAADEQGRKLGQVTVTATSAGHLRVLAWAGQWAQRSWRSRTAGTCRGGWSGTCWSLGSSWCGCRPS
jgi:hypothetical protein